MKPFEPITSTLMPLPRNDVDTDLIIPAQFLTSISREGYGENLFRRLKDQDPTFPLNLPKFKDAKILVSGENFGCGSSREHAVWALQGAGFAAVIAKSFADIFAGNSAKNGLLLITLPAAEVDSLLTSSADGSVRATVDLEKQTILCGDKTLPFTYDPFRTHCLLNGLDDLEYIFSHQDQITRFRREQEINRFIRTTLR